MSENPVKTAVCARPWKVVTHVFALEDIQDAIVNTMDTVATLILVLIMVFVKQPKEEGTNVSAQQVCVIFMIHCTLLDFLLNGLLNADFVCRYNWNKL